MFSLYRTLKPLAIRAWRYSCPSTYCSGKFFAPTMIGVACCSAAGAAAAPPRIIATPSATENAALAARRLCFRITALPPFVELVEDGPARGPYSQACYPSHDIGLQR